MKNVQNLIKNWEANALSGPKVKSLDVKLGAYDYGRICALTEIYPGRTQEQVVSDLISTILDEVAETLPYIQGSQVIAEDEFGDPIYEDIGVTPLFEELAHKYSGTSGK